MMREYHVRICEGLGVQLPGSTRQRVLLRQSNDLVRRRGVGGEAENDLVVDKMRPRVVMTATAVACNVARQNGQQLGRVLRQPDEKPCLRYLRKLRNAS